MNALLARDVRGRGFRARAGTLCELLTETQPGTFMALFQCMKGHDRVAYLRGADLMFESDIVPEQSEEGDAEMTEHFMRALDDLEES
jgi:hypothetical protein